MTNIDQPSATAAQLEGMEQASAGTDPQWVARCDTAIELAASLGLPFQAWDLVAAGLVPEPRHPNHWGPRFAAAHHNGLIEPAGAAKSKRPSVRNSLCRVWIGIPKEGTASCST